MVRDGQRLWVGCAAITLVGLAFAGLIGRLVYINSAMGGELRAYSDERQKSTIILPGRRGSILDRRGRTLAGSQDLPTIYADPTLIDNKAQVARQLAGPLHAGFEEVLHKLTKPTSPRYVVLAKAIRQSDADDIRSLNIRGVGIRKDPVRVYPMGTLAAHIIGFVGADGEGLEGTEMMCDSLLRQKPGKREVYRDVRRRAMYQAPGSYVPPTDGNNVILTLDAVIQEMVEREVARQVGKFEAECGVGLVMDAKTGEILAMASRPTYDPATAGQFPLDNRRNRPLTDPVEPGSVFKPFVMSLALAEGVTHPEEKIHCHDGLFVISRRHLHDHHPYGLLTTTQIMAHSSNIGMAILGLRLGNKKLYEGLRDFGFGEQTGIDLPGEGEGLLMPLSWWNHPYSTTSVPMGQELAVTPIQLVTAFASVVNGGMILKPRVVAAVADPEGKIIDDRRGMVIRGQSIDPSTSATMRHILAEVVNDGTGRKCQLDKWQVMGKTGTAQVPRMGRPGYEPHAYLASFIAAAPARDPDIVVLVMIRKPNYRIGYYGSQVALPAVKTILEFSLDYRNVPPDPPAPDGETTMAAASPADR